MADATSRPSRRRNADHTRHSILDAAERILARDGWPAATLAAVGAEAGVSRGTPGYFFASKAGLFDAMAERLVGAARAAAVHVPGEARDQVVSLLRRQLELVARRPALSRLALASWAAPAGSASYGAFDAFEGEMLQRLAGLIDEIPARGKIADSPGLAAELLVLCWSAGLPSPPGGSVADGRARLADRQALLGMMVIKLLGDGSLASTTLEHGTAPDETGLSDSKSTRQWRLPGVG